MNTGNYDYDNFVRVDCGLPPEAFRNSAVHEIAHFTLIKQTSYGLLCFFLRQDARDPNSPYEDSLRVLEQGFERVNECYARTRELLAGFRLAGMGRQARRARLDQEREQPYYARYRMGRLEPLLDREEPCLPDFLFLLAADVELEPLLRLELTDAGAVQRALLEHPEQLYPDGRLDRLVQTCLALAERFPPDRITPERLMAASGLAFASWSPAAQRARFQAMAAAFARRPALAALVENNLRRMERLGYMERTQESLDDSVQLSMDDCVIPAALSDRFSSRESERPVFRPEKNVLGIFLEPAGALPAPLAEEWHLPRGPRSAMLRFTDTAAGVHYNDAFAPDLEQFRPLLELYQGSVYLFLDDYPAWRKQGGFRSAPVFFRVDVPWGEMGAQLAQAGVQLRYFFLQAYSESAFFFFGMLPGGDVLCSMLAYWEMEKIGRLVQEGRLLRCPDAPEACYGRMGWRAFRDLMAAMTEDRAYGRLEESEFLQRRIL